MNGGSIWTMTKLNSSDTVRRFTGFDTLRPTPFSRDIPRMSPPQGSKVGRSVGEDQSALLNIGLMV